MDLVKKFQYSIVLFLICIIILVSGFLPSFTALLQRKVVEPEAYRDTRGVIVDMVRRASIQKRDTYQVFVEYTPIGETTPVVAILEDYVSGMEVGMEITIIYHTKDTSFILQEWSQWANSLLYGSFVLTSFLVALMMMNPASREFHQRKPKTLRERLEQYK